MADTPNAPFASIAVLAVPIGQFHERRETEPRDASSLGLGRADVVAPPLSPEDSADPEGSNGSPPNLRVETPPRAHTTPRHLVACHPCLGPLVFLSLIEVLPDLEHACVRGSSLGPYLPSCSFLSMLSLVPGKLSPRILFLNQPCALHSATHPCWFCCFIACRGVCLSSTRAAAPQRPVRCAQPPVASPACISSLLIPFPCRLSDLSRHGLSRRT